MKNASDKIWGGFLPWMTGKSKARMQILQDIDGNQTDLRSSPRVLLRRPAQIKDNDITLMYAITTDLSAGGLGLTAPNPMREGQLFSIAFDVRKEGKTRTISFGGTVTHCVKGAKGYQTGIRMVNVHPASMDTIQTLL